MLERLERAARNGITLFLVDANAPGVSMERQWRIDSRNAALVRLDHAHIGLDSVVGTVDAGADVLCAVIDRATIGLCAAAYHRDRYAELQGY